LRNQELVVENVKKSMKSTFRTVFFEVFAENIVSFNPKEIYSYRQGGSDEV